MNPISGQGKLSPVTMPSMLTLPAWIHKPNFQHDGMEITHRMFSGPAVCLSCSFRTPTLCSLWCVAPPQSNPIPCWAYLTMWLLALIMQTCTLYTPTPVHTTAVHPARYLLTWWHLQVVSFTESFHSLRMPVITQVCYIYYILESSSTSCIQSPASTSIQIVQIVQIVWNAHPVSKSQLCRSNSWGGGNAQAFGPRKTGSVTAVSQISHLHRLD